MLLVSCVAEKKALTVEEREELELQAYRQWQQSRERMIQDGYGKKKTDGDIIWKKRVSRKKLRILNKKQLNRGKNKTAVDSAN